MKKTFSFLLSIVIISFAGNAQTEETIVFMGINAGIDYDMNAYHFTKNQSFGYEYFGITPTFNIGADCGIKVSKRFRPRIELKYVNVQYGIDYRNTSLVALGRDSVTVNYIDLNLHFDYLLLTIKNFQLFASPALKYEFELNTIAANNYSGGGGISPLVLVNPGNILGGALSALFKYNFTDQFGLTLIPEYTIFFNRFATGNNKTYQRFTCNLGFEYKFGD